VRQVGGGWKGLKHVALSVEVRTRRHGAMGAALVPLPVTVYEDGRL